MNICPLDSPINNERYVCLKFNAGTIPTMIHGFAGYFDTILYKDVKLSELFVL